MGIACIGFIVSIATWAFVFVIAIVVVLVGMALAPSVSHSRMNWQRSGIINAASFSIGGCTRCMLISRIGFVLSGAVGIGIVVVGSSGGLIAVAIVGMTTIVVSCQCTALMNLIVIVLLDGKALLRAEALVHFSHGHGAAVASQDETVTPSEWHCIAKSLMEVIPILRCTISRETGNVSIQFMNATPKGLHRHVARLATRAQLLNEIMLIFSSAVSINNVIHAKGKVSHCDSRRIAMVNKDLIPNCQEDRRKSSWELREQGRTNVSID